MIPDKEQNEQKASLTKLKQEAMLFGATDSKEIQNKAWSAHLQPEPARHRPGQGRFKWLWPIPVNL